MKPAISNATKQLVDQICGLRSKKGYLEIVAHLVKEKNRLHGEFERRLL